MNIRTYRIRMIEDLLGTSPLDQELYKNFIQKKKDELITSGKLVKAPPIISGVEETQEEAEYVKEQEEKGMTGFLFDPQKGLFVFDYWIKGFFKNSANVLKEILGYRGLKQKVTNFLYVGPRQIFLGKKEADDILERPLRFMSKMGEKVALAASQILLKGLEIDFKVGVIPHPEVTLELADFLLKYGQFMGLGQWRNGGYGRFDVIMVDGQPVDWKVNPLAN